MLQNTSETFEVALKRSESNIEVRRHPRVFGVCLRKCERWLCPYEASCDVFSELGPVGGPITVSNVTISDQEEVVGPSWISEELPPILQRKPCGDAHTEVQCRRGCVRTSQV
jgi:hypothetical protein